jgi:hypothetical protein
MPKRAENTKKRPAKYAGDRVKSPWSNFKQDRKLDRCGAKKHSGEECRHRAGFGTDHPGIGRCKYHGGSTPGHNSVIARQHAVEFMGAPMDITPIQAIIWCIRISAGEVQWLSTEIAKIVEQEDWIEDTVSGKQLHVFQRARAETQDRLVSYSKIAISLGLAERSIRLAETFGATIARLLEDIKEQLVLTPAQANQWPQIVRRSLVVLEGGTAPKVQGMIEQEAS